jgi:polysaccharide biosynthesis/export protein
MLKPRHLFAAALVTLMVVTAGCRSYGPRFDARAPLTAQDKALLLQQERQRVAPLESNQFTLVDLTNVINPAWLKPRTDFFRLGPTDVIEIETMGEPDSRAQAVVGPDGKVYYSFLPGVFVWGLTLSETRQLLEKEMAKYLRVQPEIGVTLRTVGSQRVWILGSVQMPGVYTMKAPMTVIEAVTSAGGTVAATGTGLMLTDPSMHAGVPNLDYSFLLREGTMIRLDFARLLRNGDLSQNIYLQPDDFLYLRPGLMRNIYVLGAVKLPGVVAYREQMTLTAAVAGGGGTLEYAQRYGVAVVRGSLSHPRIATVDFGDIMKGKAPDVLLEPGDIVYVPFVPWRKLAILAESLIRQFVGAVAVNAGYTAVVPGATPIIPSIPTGGLPTTTP